MKDIVKNVLFGLAATASLAGVTVGAVSFVDYANTGFTGIKTEAEVSNTLSWRIIGDTITGYDGEMPEALRVPATYSLGAPVAMEKSFAEFWEMDEWLMLVQDQYMKLGDVDFATELFDYAFTDALGNVTECKTLESLDMFRMTTQEVEFSDPEKWAAMFPIVVSYEERPIVEGSDYEVTKMSASYFGASANQETMKPENVREIILPKTITSLGETSYYNYFKNLEKFTVEEGNSTYYTTPEGILVETATNEIQVFPQGITGDYVMPASLRFADNTGGLFPYSKLSSFTVNNVVDKIPNSLFSGSTINTVILGSSVTTIGQNAFNGFKGQNVVLNQGLETIGSSAFYSAKITSISIPDTVQEIEEYSFYESDLSSIIIPDSVITIGERAFADTENLTSITIEEGVQSIGGFAFSNSAVTSITIPSTVTNMGDGLFSNCTSLTSAEIKANIERLPQSTFVNCSSITSMDNVLLSDTIKIIEPNALKGLSISNMVIPEGVEHLWLNAVDSESLITLDLPSTFKSFLVGYAGIDYILANSPNIENVVIRNDIGSGIITQREEWIGTTQGFGLTKYTSKEISIYVPTNRVDIYTSSYAKFTQYTILDLATYNTATVQ